MACALVCVRCDQGHGDSVLDPVQDMNFLLNSIANT